MVICLSKLWLSNDLPTLERGAVTATMINATSPYLPLLSVMGITGLLPALKSITQDVHISEYEGLTVGIDAYGWLHRGAYTCSVELALGLETDG